jgi:Ca2+-binding EF-hand superfamily protein
MQRKRQLAGLDFEIHERFTELEVEKFKEAFTFFDRNGDHSMKVEDVPLAMRAMGALVTKH